MTLGDTSQDESRKISERASFALGYEDGMNCYYYYDNSWHDHRGSTDPAHGGFVILYRRCRYYVDPWNSK